MVYGDIYNSKDTIYTATLNSYSDKILKLEKENAELKIYKKNTGAMSKIDLDKLRKFLKRYSHNNEGQTLNFMIDAINGCVVFIETFIDEIIKFNEKTEKQMWGDKK